MASVEEQVTRMSLVAQRLLRSLPKNEAGPHFLQKVNDFAVCFFPRAFSPLTLEGESATAPGPKNTALAHTALGVGACDAAVPLQ